MHSISATPVSWIWSRLKKKALICKSNIKRVQSSTADHHNTLFEESHLSCSAPTHPSLHKAKQIFLGWVDAWLGERHKVSHNQTITIILIR